MFLDSSLVDNLVKNKPLINGFLTEEKTWMLASHADGFVRRSVYKLLVAATEKLEEDLNMEMISTNVLSSALHIDQHGSAYDYADALALVTKRCPEVWTTYYPGSGKGSAGRRLCQFLKKGSQASVPEYWSQISVLLHHVPEQLLAALPKNEAQENSSRNAVSLRFPVLEAVHSGICSKDEPRANLIAAWTTYLEVTAKVKDLFVNEGTSRPYCSEYLLPIIQQYIKPSQEWSEWTTPRSGQPELCVKAFLQMWRMTEALTQEVWQTLSARVVEHMKASLPEQSKDFAKSQKAVADEGSRWYSLQAAVMNTETSQSVQGLFIRSLTSELPAIVKLLKVRSGKPYGAAALLVAAVQLIPELLTDNAELKETVVRFVQNDIPDLFMSPSASDFTTLLGLMKRELDVKQVYHHCLKTVRDAPESAAKNNIIESVLKSEHLNLANNDILLKIVDDHLQAALADDDHDWQLLKVVLNNPAAPAPLVHHILSALTDVLATTNRVSPGLQCMKLLIQSGHRSLRLFSTYSAESQLLSRLLLLATSPNEDVAQNAQFITAALESDISTGQSLEQASRSRREIISKGLESPTRQSLPSVAPSDAIEPL